MSRTTHICQVCRREHGEDRPDPCLGLLPGVEFACCGHGEQEGYISFENGVRVNLPPICGPRCALRPLPNTRGDTIESLL